MHACMRDTKNTHPAPVTRTDDCGRVSFEREREGETVCLYMCVCVCVCVCVRVYAHASVHAQRGVGLQTGLELGEGDAAVLVGIPVVKERPQRVRVHAIFRCFRAKGAFPLVQRQVARAVDVGARECGRWGSTSTSAVAMCHRHPRGRCCIRACRASGQSIVPGGISVACSCSRAVALCHPKGRCSIIRACLAFGRSIVPEGITVASSCSRAVALCHPHGRCCIRACRASGQSIVPGGISVASSCSWKAVALWHPISRCCIRTCLASGQSIVPGGISMASTSCIKRSAGKG
jgi:hypothetical protein